MATPLLLLLLVVPTTVTTINIYYVVTANYKQLCPPDQICHSLSYYISQPNYFFTSDTTIIFLEGEHLFNTDDIVQISNVHDLTMRGHGQWPVAGPEETVVQSTVLINCNRNKGGGFWFDNSRNIAIERLTVVNCGKISMAVFNFTHVQNVFFRKNSIQNMTGYGVLVISCYNVKIKSCSYYNSAICKLYLPHHHNNSGLHHDKHGGGLGLIYQTLGQHRYEVHVDLSHSNFTKCCASGAGGGALLFARNVGMSVIFSHLLFTRNKARHGGALKVFLQSTRASIVIDNCNFLHGFNGGAVWIKAIGPNIENSHFVENYFDLMKHMNFYEDFTSELYVTCYNRNALFSLLNSTFVHTLATSTRAVWIEQCHSVTIANTAMKFANQNLTGLAIQGSTFGLMSRLSMHGCQFDGSFNLPSVVSMSHFFPVTIQNCVFSNNTGSGISVITSFQCSNLIIINSTILNNNMTGLTVVSGLNVTFSGENLIQNNRHTEGAGIRLLTLHTSILVHGKLIFHNNSAAKYGGAILIMTKTMTNLLQFYPVPYSPSCTLNVEGSVVFSGNRAGMGGSDLYNAKLTNCYLSIHRYVKSVGTPNETSWYLETPLIKHFDFSNTDRLSSISSDPIMVCFFNSMNLPDCSNRTHYIQTYSGLEISTLIATVGYYGGTSPGIVEVSAQGAKLVHYYGQHETTECFQVHFLLQNTSSTRALVKIRVKNGLQFLDAHLSVDLLECPIGFIQDKISGRCSCEQLLVDDVQCNVSVTPYEFLRSGNRWFAYMNATQCVTGTTNCPFNYCNRSNLSFSIMAPDRQCVGNRAGILCGQCQSHLSIMLGSNHCGTCSNWYLLLVLVFAFIGIMFMALLMFLNFSVSVGTINGLLFYANVVRLNKAFFFPNGNVPVVSQFISWLNLDLGIEVCLFDGLDGYWNTWLQLVFPAYLFLIVGCVIMGCRFSVWLCRLCGSHAVPALATLFLMSYTKILLAVTNALSMSRLPCNDSILTVWSVDGNIEYGSGKHLILVVFSFTILIIGLAYPVLVLCAPLLEKYSYKCIPLRKFNLVSKFKPLLDAYGGPYKDKYRFWTGLTLLMRLIIAVTFPFTLGAVNACIIITIVTGILTFWSFTNGVYKNVYLNALECFYLLNLLLLSTISLAATSLKSTNSDQVAAIVSVSLSFTVCLVTMALHLWWNFDFRRIKRKLGFEVRLLELSEATKGENNPNVIDSQSPSVQRDREPLLFHT